MNAIEQQNEFRSWKVLPARLDVFQTAWFLGFKPHDIPVLTTAGLLKPLGHPARNCIKYYATETLDALRRDEKWLARSSDVIREHWHGKNARKHSACGPGAAATNGVNQPFVRRDRAGGLQRKEKAAG